ncbi:MAG TPA: hypothetical protein VFU10_12890, partial [Gaiellaceae bacterium]|nr:hypothetical protein [Gaiellaceae bacterium]
ELARAQRNVLDLGHRGSTIRAHSARASRSRAAATSGTPGEKTREIVEERSRRGVFNGMSCGSPEELDRRRTGADEIMLLWYPACARLEVFIRNVATGVGLHFEVAGGRGPSLFRSLDDGA